MAALEAKNRFGELLDTAQREPVTIERHGRPVAIVLSVAAYAELEDLRFEALRAEIAKGLDDVAAGDVVDAAEAFDELRKRAT